MHLVYLYEMNLAVHLVVERTVFDEVNDPGDSIVHQSSPS